MLLGGSANTSAGVIDEVTVTRDSNGHIDGFGSVAQLSTAPYIDGGLAYGLGGDLFFTGYPNNFVGEIEPGSTSPNLTVSLNGNVSSSVGTLAFIPAGFNGAGSFVIGSFTGGAFCTAPLTPDATIAGAYDIGTCTGNGTSVGGGPEGIIYVPQGSTSFVGQNVLISEYTAGEVVAYGIDSNGLPQGAGTPFITGLTGVEGAVLDPVTSDYLFSTFNGGNQIVEVQGFSASPEPASFFLFIGGIAALIWRHRVAV